MIGKFASGVTQYFLNDRLSVRLMLDTSGNVLGRQGHLPFGEDFGVSGSQDKHHFTSYEGDAEGGTDYAVNRQYSQVAGRFMRVDQKAGSLSNPQSFDRYAYVTNDPIRFTDPSGLDSFLPGSASGWGLPWEANWFFNSSGILFGPNSDPIAPNPGPSIPVSIGQPCQNVVVSYTRSVFIARGNSMTPQ